MVKGMVFPFRNGTGIWICQNGSEAFPNGGKGGIDFFSQGEHLSPREETTFSTQGAKPRGWKQFFLPKGWDLHRGGKKSIPPDPPFGKDIPICTFYIDELNDWHIYSLFSISVYLEGTSRKNVITNHLLGFGLIINEWNSIWWEGRNRLFLPRWTSQPKGSWDLVWSLMNKIRF